MAGKQPFMVDNSGNKTNISFKASSVEMDNGSTVQNALTSAVDDASSAKTTANSISSVANTANTNASSAKTTAQQAASTANLVYSAVFRQPSATYEIGNVVYLSNKNNYNTSKIYKLVCIKAGSTSNSDSSALDTDLREGSIITDGTVTWQIDSLADNNYRAAHQNSMFRGVNITDYYNSGLLSTNIRNGYFVGVHIGDYIIKTVTTTDDTYTSIKWLVGAMDPQYLTVETQANRNHHILLISEGTPRTGCYMRSKDDTSTGFLGTTMWTTLLPKWKTGIQNAFGSDHVLPHNDLLTDAISSSGSSQSNVTTEIYVNIPNESMVFGHRMYGNVYDKGNFPRILPLFAFQGHSLSYAPSTSNNGTVKESSASANDDNRWFWIRTPYSGAGWVRAVAGRCGYQSASYTNTLGGLKPYFLWY